MDNNIAEISNNEPYSIEAEQAVLAAIILEPSNISDVLKQINADSFYRNEHKEIFSTIVEMYTAGTAIDSITISERLYEKSVFASQEDARIYISKLAQLLPQISHFEYYAEIVKEKYYLRTLISIAQEIIKNSIDPSIEAKQILDSAEQKIFEIRQGREANGLVRISEVIKELYTNLQLLSGDDKEKYLGLSSGFPELDNYMTGLNKSDLILLAARPAMGKTSFALNIASNVAEKGGTVAVFSLEMSKEQLVSRLLSSTARIQGTKLKTGSLNDSEWSDVASAASIIRRMPIYIDDTSGITVAEMKSKLRRINGLSLVVIDYLQLMTTGRHSDNRVQEVAEITRGLKILAKELNVPIITLSQLSRGPEARTEHRPMLADLRDSGSIEQDADSVLFLYRDEYYNPESPDVNIAECIIAKNRHGEIGTVKLGWNGEFTLFRPLERRMDEA